MISYSAQEKAAIDIALMLDGFRYSDAKAILDEAHEKILGALKVNLSADDLKPSDKSQGTHRRVR